MRSKTAVSDGWYKAEHREWKEVWFTEVVKGVVDGGKGFTVEDCIKDGYVFTPAVCMTQKEFDDAIQKAHQEGVKRG